MRQLVYAMRFTGQATSAGPDGGVLTVRATAGSSTLATSIDPHGLDGRIESVPGGEATLESEVTLTGATSFQEVGVIAFGSHVVRFSTVGSGYLGSGPDPPRRTGAVVGRVDGGDGQFAGARGLITSIVLIDEDRAVTVHHLGVVYLP
jgi:hypothetical protein